MFYLSHCGSKAEPQRQFHGDAWRLLIQLSDRGRLGGIFSSQLLRRPQLQLEMWGCGAVRT